MSKNKYIKNYLGRKGRKDAKEQRRKERERRLLNIKVQKKLKNHIFKFSKRKDFNLNLLSIRTIPSVKFKFGSGKLLKYDGIVDKREVKTIVHYLDDGTFHTIECYVCFSEGVWKNAPNLEALSKYLAQEAETGFDGFINFTATNKVDERMSLY